MTSFWQFSLENVVTTLRRMHVSYIPTRANFVPNPPLARSVPTKNVVKTGRFDGDFYKTLTNQLRARGSPLSIIGAYVALQRTKFIISHDCRSIVTS